MIRNIRACGTRVTVVRIAFNAAFRLIEDFMALARRTTLDLEHLAVHLGLWLDDVRARVSVSEWK